MNEGVARLGVRKCHVVSEIWEAIISGRGIILLIGGRSALQRSIEEEPNVFGHAETFGIN